MVRIHRSRRTALGIALVLAGALVAPLAVSAQEQALAVVPVAPSWDEISGYRSVEASRAAVSPLIVADPAWDVTSGYGAVERSRASRSAMIALSATSSQVSPDMRWAPADVMAAGLARGRATCAPPIWPQREPGTRRVATDPRRPVAPPPRPGWLAMPRGIRPVATGPWRLTALTSRPTPAASITPGRARVCLALSGSVSVTNRMHQGCPSVTRRVGLGHHRSGTEASVNNAAPVAKTIVFATR